MPDHKVLKTKAGRAEIGYGDRFADAAGDIAVMVAEWLMESSAKLPPEGQRHVQIFVETKLVDVVFNTLESTSGFKSVDGLKWMEENKEDLARSMYQKLTTGQ